MNIFFEEHRIMLKALLSHQVNFMLIGGYAVNLYGYNRVTGDMDIWLLPDNENKERLMQALISLNFDDEGIAIIRSWDFTTPQKFHIGNEKQPDKVEFMTHISGITYEVAQEQINIEQIEELRLPFIHYNSLIKNKKSTGRIKDMADVEYLEKIKREKT